MVINRSLDMRRHFNVMRIISREEQNNLLEDADEDEARREKKKKGKGTHVALIHLFLRHTIDDSFTQSRNGGMRRTDLFENNEKKP